ncbi:hypothetical protein [Pulveribacter suum]|uniref:hypothetical protein n=1 Tax=Pulveribacter suum TaxID=2116657 RepID=UPI00130081A2|nr:hypothetical protein [Pulveribacter suum]
MTLPRSHPFTLSPLRAAALGLAPLLLAACGGGSDSDATPRYLVGGQVAGLQQGTLVLHNNGGDALRIAAGSTDFSFPTLLEAGQPYAVTVASQPAGQSCAVTSGNGVVQGDVRDVRVQCAPAGDPAPDPAPGDGSGAGAGAASACFNAKLFSPGTRYRWHMRGEVQEAGVTTHASMVQVMAVRGGASFAGASGLVADSGEMTITSSAGAMKAQITHYHRQENSPAGPVVLSYGSELDMQMSNGMGTRVQTIFNPPSELRKYTLAPGGSYAHSATARITATTTFAGQSSTTTTTDTDSYTLTYLGHKSVTVPAGTFQACHYRVGYAGEPSPWDEYIAVGSGLPLVMVGDDGDGGRVRMELQADSEVNGVPVRDWHAAPR